MSQTSTLTTTTTRARIHAVGCPSDYDLHHSGTSIANDTAHEELSLSRNTNGDAPDWPTNHRRIPPYRPINRNLNQDERRVTTSFGESVFLTIMFTGVRTNAGINWLWRLTGERFNENLFKYTKIGGEF